MNDERTELRGQVIAVLQRVKYVKLGGDLNPLAEEIIALAEADVARRLLSEEAVEAAADVVSNFHDYIGETGYFASSSTSEKYRLQAALRHIGIEPREDGEG